MPTAILSALILASTLNLGHIDLTTASSLSSISMPPGTVGDVQLAQVNDAVPAISPVEMYTVRVTAYSSSPDETDSTPFITASGEHVRDGIIAANFLPFGTEIMIPALFGEKIFTVEDRMNRKIPDGLDIWMPSKSMALRFGVEDADIFVVKGNLNGQRSTNIALE